MAPIVVAGSQNNFTFGVCDFGLSPPAAHSVDPAFGGNCVVACDGNLVAAGDGLGSQVQLVDISNPAAPTLLGIVNTMLSGIGSVAIRGNQVAAGELNGFRIVLIDFSNATVPSIVGTKNTPVGGFTSLAFTGTSRVAGAGPNGPPTTVEVNFGVSPATATTFDPPGVTGGFSLDADATANRIVLGNQNGTQVILLNASTKAVISNLTTSIGSVGSVAISGGLVLAGGPNDANVLRINFGVSPPAVTSFNPAYPSGASGSQVAISGTTGACGAIVGSSTPVKLFNLAPATPSALGTCNPGVASVGTLAFGPLTAVAPATAEIAVMPTTLAFGPVMVGTTATTGPGGSMPAPLTVTNTGSAALTVSALTSNDPRFAATTPTPFTVPAGGSHPINVAFTPSAEQSFSGTLSIASNDPSDPTVTVALSGAGARPHASVNPSSVAFGDVAMCLSGTRQVTVHNSGQVPLTVSSISTSGAPFAASPGSLVVPSNADRTVTLTFAPGALGPASGTLTLATNDPANSSIAIQLTGNGLPTPPPAISVTPTVLAFGLVPRQFFIGLRVTISNTGPCQALSVSLSTSGAPFFVTDTDPTTVAPTSTTVSGTVTPGAPRRYVVVFAPTALGPASGTLTITSNDPANPTVSVPLTGNGVDESPAALELVLDRSGSMSDLVAGGTKMDALKRAVKMFADLLIAGQGDAIGTVEFDDAVHVLTSLQPLTAAQRTQVEADVDTLFPRDLTSIGGGLQTAQAQIGGSSIARKAILVFTDGIENTDPLIAAVEPGILSAGIEIYAVGLGRPEDISADKLGQLAASSSGRFFLSDDPLILRKNFVQVLADAFRQQMAADPIVQIKQGGTVDVPVWITRCERRISFVLNWDDPASQLDFRVIAPDGTVLSPNSPATNQLVRYGQQPGYRYYQIALPPIDPGSGDVIGPTQIGRWIMRISGANLNKGTERCTTSVFVESDLEMDIRIKAGDSRSPLRVRVALTDAGQPILNAHVRATVIAPTKPYAQRLRAISKAATERGPIDDLLGAGLIDRAVRLVRKSGRVLIPTRRRVYKKLRGKGGVYSLVLDPPLVDGVYQIEIEASGEACDGTFQRYASLAAFVTRAVDIASTTVTVGPIGPGATAVTLTVVPRDASGAGLGPGLGRDLHVDTPAGTKVGVIDNLDGSYTVRLDWSGARRPRAATLDVVGGRVTVPLPAPRKAARAATSKRRKPKRRR